MCPSALALGPASRTVTRGSALAAAVAVLSILAGPLDAAGQSADRTEALSVSFRKAARKVLPAVVTVRAVGVGVAPRPFVPFPGLNPFPDTEPIVPVPPEAAVPPTGEAGGSGVVIDAEKGYVLTNDHVVNGASRVVVILHNGRERPVTQVRRDPKSDLALLVIDPKGLAQAEWGDSDALDTGDWVLAVGQPFGLSGTVTAGIISGKGRGVGVTMYEDLIQTDAAINPGNSGGPLVNLKGQVVGINTALKTRRGGFEGVGFAVPASRAKRVAADLARDGRVRRAYLGIAIGPVDPATAERLEQPGAVVINDVSADSPAEKAGLRRGDVVVKLQGQAVQGLGALQSAIEFATVGAALTLTVDRGGDRRDVEVRPEEQPDRFGRPEPVRPRPATPDDSTGTGTRGVGDRGVSDFAALGLRLGDRNPRLTRQFRLRDPSRGVVVVGVEPDGPADRGGLEIGMVITDAAGRRVNSAADFRSALDRRDKHRDLLLRVLRDAKPEFRVIPEEPGSPRPDRPDAPKDGKDEDLNKAEPQDAARRP